MAKSKKALKALKRRKEAKGRSRVLKERQDYTGGGRVKAFTGFPGNISIPNQEQIQKQVDAYKKSLEQEAATSPTGTPPTPQSSDVDLTAANQETQDQIAANQEARELEARREILRRNGTIGMDTDGDGRLSDAEKYKAATGVDMPPRGEQPPPSEEAVPADTSPPSDEAAPPPSDAAPPAQETTPFDITSQTGRVPPDQVNLDSSPFDYSGLTIDPNGQVLNVRVNDGSGNRLVQIPFGSLSPAQQQDLRNIAANNPDLDQRALISFDYFNRAFGLKEAVEEETTPPTDETPTDTPPTDEAPDEEVTIPPIYSGTYADFAGPKPDLLKVSGAAPNSKQFQDQQTAITNWITAEQKWNSMTPQERFDFYKGSAIAGGRQPGADPAEGVLDRIYNEERRKDFRTDRPEAFETQQTSLEGTVLSGRQLSDVTDITQRNVTAGDISAASGTFRGAAAQNQISAQSMEAYNQAEANYFDKYPEARQAIQDGTYKNVFDYHAKVGIEQGNTLTFDTSKIAKADFDRLAQSTSSELQQTQAAQRDAEAEQAALARRPVFTEDLRSQIDPATG